MESWCDCRVPIYLQRILFRLRGLREWGGLTTTEALFEKILVRDYVGIHIPRNETTSPLWEWYRNKSKSPIK